jgi:DNA invertase Pin-like site-specific DNA recombinase
LTTARNSDLPFCYAGGVEAGTRALAYCRVSTTEQGVSGLGLDAQEAAIRAYCERRGWRLASVVREVASGQKKTKLPVLEALLCQLTRGDVLVVAKADRLARSLSAYVALIDRAHAGGWHLVAADGSVDLLTPHGRAMAAMGAVFAQLEAELIGDRTRVALQAAKQRGTTLGRRPSPLPAGVASKIARLRGEGESLRAIADVLNHASVPAPDGGRWYAATVSRVSKRVLEAEV